MRIRKACESDGRVVGQLIRLAYGELLRPYYRHELLAPILPMISRPKRGLLTSGRFYVAEIEEKVVGCGGWSHERPGDGALTSGLAHVRQFAVHPDFGGRGVGRRLIDLSVDRARREGVQMLECDSTLMAEGFYARLGFSTTEFIDVRMGPIDFPCVKMHRALKTDGSRMH